MLNEDFKGLGNSIMADRIRSFDWSKNPLGHYSQWPISLKLYVSQILSHKFDQLILWGPDFIQIHNDAFLKSRDMVEDPPILGTKSAEFFKKTWYLVKDKLLAVFEKGESFYNEDQGFPDLRKGHSGMAYYTYSYSPLLSEQGKIEGVLVTSIETTGKVESYRKLEEAEQLQRLSLEAAEMGSFQAMPETGQVVRSKEYLRILGVDEDLPTSEYWKLYVEDDLKIREEALKELEKTGKLNYIARFKIRDEIRFIHVMGKTIYDSQNKAQKLIGVIQDITEKSLAEEKVIQANKNLQLANKKQKELQKQKDQFLQVASHELRTPITAIKGFAQLVEEILSENGHEKEAKLLERLNQRIDHIHLLLETLFDVSKINAGKLDFKEEVFELTQIIRDIVEDLRYSSNQHTLKEEYDFKAEVKFDKFRITQVLVNLLSNALKYSPEGEEIQIRTRKLDSSIAVDIMDQGIGIPQEDLPHIFDQYFRASNLDDYGIRGLGLGLFLSAEIIRKSGGEIWAESEVGKGSTFTITLPLFELQ